MSCNLTHLFRNPALQNMPFWLGKAENSSSVRRNSIDLGAKDLFLFHIPSFLELDTPKLLNLTHHTIRCQYLANAVATNGFYT